MYVLRSAGGSSEVVIIMPAPPLVVAYHFLLLITLVKAVTVAGLRCNTFLGTDASSSGAGIETCLPLVSRCIQREFYILGVRTYSMSCDEFLQCDAMQPPRTCCTHKAGNSSFTGVIRCSPTNFKETRINASTFGKECSRPCTESTILAAPASPGARTLMSAGQPRSLRTLDALGCVSPSCSSLESSTKPIHNPPILLQPSPHVHHHPRHPPPLPHPPPPVASVYAIAAAAAAATAAAKGERLLRCPTEGAYAAPWHKSEPLCREPTTGRCNSTFKVERRLSGHGKCFPDGDPLVGAAIMWGGYGCYPGLNKIWVANRCAGRFTCENGKSIACGTSQDNGHTNCSCT